VRFKGDSNSSLKFKFPAFELAPPRDLPTDPDDDDDDDDE